MTMIDSLDAAVDFFFATLEEHPQRDLGAAQNAVIDGHTRRFPVIHIGHQNRPQDDYEPQDEMELPEVDMPEGPEADLAREIVGMLEPLKLMNPVQPAFSVSHGPGTLVPSFDIPLDPAVGDSPAFTRSLQEVLDEPPPDPAESGLLPQMREDIERIKAHTPPRFKIGQPDTQGPFNIAHAVIGEEALTAPYTDPEAFRRFMDRVTDFWIRTSQNLKDWIGPERRAPWNRLTRICECSVNLVSPDTYRDHILRCDRRIARECGPIDVHTCSGPHVFHTTLEELPNVAATEAGYIEKTAAGHTPVEEAMDAVAGTSIILRIGQELPPGEEWETIRADLDRYRRHPLLLFSYTGMHWWKKDRPAIRKLHRKADRYWEEMRGSTKERA